MQVGVMSNQIPLVSVVVVCFNGLDMSRRCLASLFQQDCVSTEIIVVDNGSDEDIRGMVAREFSQAQLIRLDDNLGFAGGYNRGIEAARGKYVAVINNDAIASPRWLSSMIKVAEADGGIGAVASVILDENRPGLLDSCGVGIAMDGMSRQAMRGMVPPALEAPRDVLMPSGCACLLRKEALKVTGLFDESFFAYCEDSDLGLRMRWAGYKAVVAPGTEVFHHYSMTGGKFSLRKVFLVERNHFWVAVKNFPWPLLLLNPFMTFWRYVTQLYVLLTGSGEIGEFKDKCGIASIIVTLIRAHCAALAGLPSMFKKRMELAGNRTLTSVDMLRLLLRFRIPMIEIVSGVACAGKRKKAG